MGKLKLQGAFCKFSKAHATVFAKRRKHRGCNGKRQASATQIQATGGATRPGALDPARPHPILGLQPRVWRPGRHCWGRASSGMPRRATEVRRRGSGARADGVGTPFRQRRKGRRVIGAHRSRWGCTNGDVLHRSSSSTGSSTMAGTRDFSRRLGRQVDLGAHELTQGGAVDGEETWTAIGRPRRSSNF